MANGPSERNRKFTFGFLNTAQDINDADITNSVELDGVDLDKLALGTIQLENYSSAGSGAPDWQNTKIVGDSYRINGNEIEFLESEDPDVWVDIDNYLLPNGGTTPDPPNIILEESQGGIELNDPTSWTNFVESDITVDGVAGATDPALTTKVMINPSNFTQTNNAFTYKIRIKSGATTFERQIIGVDSGYAGTYSISGTVGSTSGYLDIGYGIRIAMDSAESYSANDEFIFNVATDLLEDGQYFYSVSQVKMIGGKEVESLYSEVTNSKISNENALGSLTTYSRSVVTIERDVTDEKWLYRKGPQDEEWFRVAIIEAGTGDAEFIDNILTSSLIDSKIIEDLNPVSMADLLESVDSTGWSHIFEKDNRLWAVPSDKKDVVFYSEPLQFWRWIKTNSIGFNGDFRGTASLRDTANVAVQNTAVFVTSSGLYNVYGNGSEDEPYIRVTHEVNFGTVEDTLVKANNVLYMISDGETYSDGEWGRKLYAYDLMKLTELSGIVRNSDPFVDDDKTISYVNQIGGDKLKILMSDNSSMIYHITGDGFGESSSTSLTSWNVKSAVFHPSYSFQGKMMNVDKFRMEWNGTITVEWIKNGVTLSSKEYVNTARGWDEFQLPGQFGGNMQLKVSGSTGVLYDFWFVSAK